MDAFSAQSWTITPSFQATTRGSPRHVSRIGSAALYLKGKSGGQDRRPDSKPHDNLLHRGDSSLFDESKQKKSFLNLNGRERLPFFVQRKRITSVQRVVMRFPTQCVLRRTANQLPVFARKAGCFCS